LLQRNFRRFYTWLAYSFNHNQYDFSQYDPSKFPNNFQIEHSLSGAVTYDWKNCASPWAANGISRPTTTPTLLSNRQISYNTPNNEVLDDFFSSTFRDLTSGYWGRKPGYKFTLRCLISLIKAIR
jgi:hypothetical protein